jgi:polysaccharide pyruvyl transferase WcaK-like protein
MARHFGSTSPHIDLAHDPALCADDVYGVTRASEATFIGLGIMAPLSSYPGTDPGVADRLSEDRLMRFWRELITLLHGATHPVALFTTGDLHDHAFATRIYGSLADDLRDRIRLVPQPARPADLVATIAGFRVILAQRLHAHIIAYSLQVPSVGIIWDSKVEAFAILTDRQTFFMNADSLSPQAASDKIGQALAAGVCPERHAALQADVRASVSRLLERAGLLERA